MDRHTRAQNRTRYTPSEPASAPFLFPLDSAAQTHDKDRRTSRTATMLARRTPPRPNGRNQTRTSPTASTPPPPPPSPTKPLVKEGPGFESGQERPPTPESRIPGHALPRPLLRKFRHSMAHDPRVVSWRQSHNGAQMACSLCAMYVHLLHQCWLIKPSNNALAFPEIFTEELHCEFTKTLHNLYIYTIGA